MTAWSAGAASRTDTLAHLLPGIEEVRQIVLLTSPWQSKTPCTSGSLVQVPQSGHFTPDALRACIRANFAASKDAPADNQDQLLDQAFSALRILSEQMYMQQCSSHTVTNGIQVDVTSVHVGVSVLHCCAVWYNNKLLHTHDSS